MKEAFESAYSTVKDKLGNPFFGTLIFVWLIRNWELVYTVFNFDKDCTLNDKKSFIINYYLPKNIFKELFYNIAFAFALMILGYVMVIISRMIVNLVENNITPFLNKKTDSRLVVNKSLFERVEKEKERFLNLYNIEREKAANLESLNASIREANRGFTNNQIELEKDNKNLKLNISELKEEVAYWQNTLPGTDIPYFRYKIYKNLKENDLDNFFIEYSKNSDKQRKDIIYPKKKIDILMEMKLVEFLTNEGNPYAEANLKLAYYGRLIFSEIEKLELEYKRRSL